MGVKERFAILCQHFLASQNPRCEKEVVVLDCVLAVPEYLIIDVGRGKSNDTLRHLAHELVMAATRLSVGLGGELNSKEFDEWLIGWWEKFG